MLRGAKGYSALALQRGTANKRISSHQTVAPSPSSAAFPPCWQSAHFSSLAREPTDSSVSSVQTSPELKDYNVPGLATVDWHKDLANSVSLIGTVFRDFDLKHLDAGKVLASTSLRVKRQEKDYMWFRLQFWNELARVAVTQVKKDDCIYVSGSVYVEKFTSNDNKEMTFCKVVGKDLKFVRQHTPDISETSAVTRMSKPLEDLWEDVFKNPSQWWDNRSQKVNMKSPDFRNKTTGDGLWINFGTPSWVKERLNIGAASERSIQGEGLWGAITEGISDLEKGWQDYFRNPSDWWDNRDHKRSPNGPDFKHKANGQALWIDNTKNPAWVKSQLAAKEEGQKPGLSSPLNRADKLTACMEEENLLFF